MKVKDIMVRNVVTVGPEEKVSVAFNKIKKYDINQLPVLYEKKYAGMVALKDVVVKNIDPTKTNVSNVAVSTPSLRSTDTVGDAARALLNSGFRALPVIDNQMVGILSETDIMKALDKVSRNVLALSVGDVATGCDYVRPEDNVGKVKNIMFYNNVSRVPVVDEGNIVGVIGLVDLIKLLEGRGTLSKGKQSGAIEKMNVEESRVSSFMHKPVVLYGNATVKDAIRSLANSEEAIVLDGEVKIVTPKDILEFILGRKEKKVHVQIVGMKDEGPLFTAKMDKAVEDFIQKMGKMIDIQYLFLHVEKYHKTGSKQKYSIRARFGTPMGLFVAKAWGWDPVSVAQETMDNLESTVLRKHGRKRDERKRRNVLSKRR